MRAAAVFLCSLILGAAEPRPSPSPTPTSLQLLQAHVASRVVGGEAAGRRFVVAIRLTDTHEAFTVELTGDRIEVREGLPPAASVVLSGRRSTMTKVLRGSETLSGAVRRNLVDVEGDIDRLFELMTCCVRSPAAAAPTAPAR